MVAYNFQARFAPDVEWGRKLQTIRTDGGRRHARIGEAVQLYTAMRRPECRLLGLGTCTATWRVRLTFAPKPHVKMILLGPDGDWLSGVAIIRHRDGLDEFAERDGFLSWGALLDWFRAEHGMRPFEGTLIKWKLDAAKVA